jgi:hypothetical protein
VALYSLILEIEQMVFGVRAAHGHVRRPRTTESMHAGIGSSYAWYGHTEHPKVKVARHTVRPGSLGLTLFNLIRVSKARV